MILQKKTQKKKSKNNNFEIITGFSIDVYDKSYANGYSKYKPKHVNENESDYYEKQQIAFIIPAY